MPGRPAALILLLAMLIPSPARSEEVRVTAWKANIRSSPSRSSSLVVTLDRGAGLEVLGRRGSWYHVRVPSSGAEGYIHASMIGREGRAPAAPAGAGQGEEVRVTGWQANVRAKPNRSSAVVSTLDRGASLEVLGRSGSWYWVRIPSSREAGYVHASMVEVAPRVASAPVPQAPAPPRPRPTEPPPRPPPAAEPSLPVVPEEPQLPAYTAPPPPPVFVAREETKLRFRAFGQGGFEAFHARDTFDTIFGSSTGGTFGGGFEVKYRNLFLQVAVDRFRRKGERVFIFDGEVFPLGIEDTVTITPLTGFVGYRVLSIGPATLFAGAGVGSYKLQETFAFADETDSVAERFTGYLGRVGVEVQVHRWVNVAAEFEYATVPSALGTGGVSEIFAEENLGGTSFRIRVLVGP